MKGLDTSYRFDEMIVLQDTKEVMTKVDFHFIGDLLEKILLLNGSINLSWNVLRI